MLKWLARLFRSIFGTRRADLPRSMREPRARPREVIIPRAYPTMPLLRHDGQDRPPKLHWKPSHPSTIRRFKAEVTCSRGHGITLRDHAVEADGRVVPSIVCKTAGCDFHEIVRLEGWDAGAIAPYSAHPPADAA